MANFPNLNMVKLRLNQIAYAENTPSDWLGPEWAARDALYWLTGDEAYADSADEAHDRFVQEYLRQSNESQT